MNYTTAKKILFHSARVEGWFTKEAGMLIAMVDEFQKVKNITGDIFEIGVHHGKSSIFFSHLLTQSENLHICDLFSIEGNVSSSGSGNEEIFKNNMLKYAPKPVAVYHKCLSSNLTPENVGKDYRMFHIDGGHNPDEALADLILASKVLHKQGVIILDDPFREEWPGVTEALVNFLQLNKDFEGIVVGFNKILLSRKEISKEYQRFIDDREGQIKYGLDFPYEYKRLPFTNSELNIFFIPTRYLTLKKVKVWLSKSALNKGIIRKLVTKFR
jgi:hypothetical protein